MVERRSLIEGIKPPQPAVDPDKVKEFVNSAKVKTAEETNLATTSTVESRSPFSTRIRTDFWDALKRASLERQLKKIEPNSICDILEEAMEPWLKMHGYLT